jgi:hypothetical protein
VAATIAGWDRALRAVVMIDGLRRPAAVASIAPLAMAVVTVVAMAVAEAEVVEASGAGGPRVPDPDSTRRKR